MFMHTRAQAEILEETVQAAGGEKLSPAISCAVCSTSQRKSRKDALSHHDFDIVEMFWVASTEASPNKQNVIKLKGGDDGDEVEHVIHRQYEASKAIFDKFKAERPTMKIEHTLFNECKPWFVRPGQADTCQAVTGRLK
jgi:hypothetical protein